MVLTRAQRRRLRDEANAELRAERENITGLANEEKEWSSEDDNETEPHSYINSPYAEEFRAKVTESLEGVTDMPLRRNAIDEITNVKRRRISLDPSDVDSEGRVFQLTNQLLSRPMEFIAPPVAKDTAWDIRQELRRSVFGNSGSTFRKNMYHSSITEQSVKRKINDFNAFDTDKTDIDTEQPSTTLIAPPYHNDEQLNKTNNDSTLICMIFLTLILSALIFAPSMSEIYQYYSVSQLNTMCVQPLLTKVMGNYHIIEDHSASVLVDCTNVILDEMNHNIDSILSMFCLGMQSVNELWISLQDQTVLFIRYLIHQN